MPRKPNSKKDNTTIIVAVIAATATLLTAVISLAMPFAERLANEKTATVVPANISTPQFIATSTINQTAINYPVIFEDDFTINRGIYEWESERSFGEIKDGTYRVGVTLPNIVTWRVYSVVDVSDFHLKTSIIMSLSTNYYSCGIVFRKTDNGRYLFGINNDQRYEFINIVGSGDNVSENTLVDWLSNPAINQYGINNLEIIAKHDVFELFVNGTKVKTITDGTHTNGEVGFYVSSYGGGQEAIVEFDNLIIEER